MRVYHATRKEEYRDGILKTFRIDLGMNVGTTKPLAHVSSADFDAGAYELNVICGAQNEAWIFTLEIPDDHPLVQDPADSDTWPNWLVSEVPIPIIRIDELRYVENVDDFETHLIKPRKLPIKWKTRPVR